MPDQHDIATKHLRRWLSKNLTGCSFAATFAATEDTLLTFVKLSEVDDQTVADINEFIDAACAVERLPILLFPRARTPNSIARILRALQQNERWSCELVPWLGDQRARAVQVGLYYRTTQHQRSSAMGFAPLGCMPVTRRAPYVAISLWAGGSKNPFVDDKLGRPRSMDEVGFIDAPLYAGQTGRMHDRKKHGELWEQTRKSVRDVLGDPSEDGRSLKNVAFCLPDTAVALLDL